LAWVKQKVAVGRLGPSEKCMQVVSPEPSKDDSNGVEVLGQTAVQLLLIEIAMAQLATEVIVHLKPVKF